MVTTITATTMFHLLGYTIASRSTPCAEQNPECQTDFSHLGCAQHFRRAPWVTQTPPCTTRLSQFCCEHLRFTRLRRFGWLMCGGGWHGGDGRCPRPSWHFFLAYGAHREQRSRRRRQREAGADEAHPPPVCTPMYLSTNHKPTYIVSTDFHLKINISIAQ